MFNFKVFLHRFCSRNLGFSKENPKWKFLYFYIGKHGYLPHCCLNSGFNVESRKRSFIKRGRLELEKASKRGLKKDSFQNEFSKNFWFFSFENNSIKYTVRARKLCNKKTTLSFIIWLEIFKLTWDKAIVQYKQNLFHVKVLEV